MLVGVAVHHQPIPGTHCVSPRIQKHIYSQEKKKTKIRWKPIYTDMRRNSSGTVTPAQALTTSCDEVALPSVPVTSQLNISETK